MVQISVVLKNWKILKVEMKSNSIEYVKIISSLLLPANNALLIYLYALGEKPLP